MDRTHRDGRTGKHTFHKIISKNRDNNPLNDITIQTTAQI